MGVDRQPTEARWILSRFGKYALAPVIMVLPFAGTAFLGDQRRYIYMFTNETGGSLWRLIGRTLDRVDFFLSLGNFRPLGRFVLVAVDMMTLEAALATGIPPHVLAGAIRMIMVAVLAVAGMLAIATLCRAVSARIPSGNRSPEPLMVVFAPILALCLVASGLHAVMWFPVFLVGVVALALAVPVLVVSHPAASRRWSWQQWRLSAGGVLEPVLMILLGAALAMIYDLAYLVPVLCVALLAMRVLLAGGAWKGALRSGAMARLIALWVGFAAVFLPVRIWIAERCSAVDCYGATEVVLSGLSPAEVWDRIVSGLPLAGWYHTISTVGDELALKTLAEYLDNWTTFPIVAVLAWFAIRAFSKGLVPLLGWEPGTGSRMGLASIALGALILLLTGVLVGLSRTVQVSEWPLGTPWRETSMMQVGWALVLLGVVVMATSRWCSRLTHRWKVAVAAVIGLGLFAAMLVTYYTNDQYARMLRSRPTENAVALVSASVVNFDTSEAGERARCEVLRSYPTSDRFGVLDMLNELTDSRYGQPFCRPTTAGGYPSGFADDDGSPHELAIDTLHAAAILRGCDDDPHRFCPDRRATRRYAVWLINRLGWVGILEPGVSDLLGPGDELTRGDMARFLVEASDDLAPVPQPQMLFSDTADRGLAAYAAATYQAGIIEACFEDPLQFCPEEDITRGELITMVARAFGLVPR